MRYLVRQLTWLLLMFFVSMILFTTFFNWGELESYVIAKMINTVMVFSALELVAFTFTGLTFFIFALKEFRFRYTRNIPAVIILLNPVLFVLYLI